MKMMSKVMAVNDLLQVLKPIRVAGKQIVFTNGCFDILHVGHVRYLASAKAQGDILVVGLNSDESVRAIKDKGRPIISQEHRQEVLAGLSFVDYIIIFDEPDPLRIIQALKPDVLVKGADWPEEKIVGADVVRAHGGRVISVPLVPDISTSMIIDRIAKRYKAK